MSKFAQMLIFRHPDLRVVHRGSRGRAIVAKMHLPADTLLEVCPVVILPAEQRAAIDGTILYDYYFDWGEDEKGLCICLGWGSLYNHSYQANAAYEMDFLHQVIKFYTTKPISPGEEICINYNGEPDDQTPVWFEVS
jgi:uncharacterized protein